MQKSIQNILKHILSVGAVGFLLILGAQCRGDSPAKIIADFKSALALMEQYDYGETHEWLGNFQKIMVRVHNNSQVQEEIESLMIEALKRDASVASKQMICTYMGPIATEKAIPVLEEMIKDEHLSAPALSVMQQIPDEAADEALLKGLSVAEGPSKTGIINVLALRKTRYAVKELKNLIFDPDASVSTSAVFALGKIGTEEASDALKNSFDNSSEPLKWEIAAAWLNCTDQMNDSNTQDALLIFKEVIDAQPPPSILYAALKGVLVRDEEMVERIIYSLLTGNVPEAQTLAIPLIRDLNSQADMSEYLNILPQLDEYQQMQLFTVLADRNNQAVKEIVKRSTEHSNPDIRLASLMAMRNLANADDVEFLARVASKTRGRERDMARECLEIIKGDDVNAKIIQGLQNPDPNIRVEYIRSIGERNLTTAVDPVLETLHDQDRKIRMESYKVLGKLAEPDKLNEILDVSLSAGSSAERNEAERTITLIALKIQDEDQRVEDILALLSEVKDDETMMMLIQSLGNIGSKTALPALQEFLMNENTEIQIAAVKALSVWPDATPLDDLKSVVESSGDIKVHNLAIRGLVRMIQIDDDLTEEDKFEECKQAYVLTNNLDEKKIVISGLSEIRSKGAFQMAVELLESPDLYPEAEAAIFSMAGPLGRKYPDYTKAELNRLIESTNNQDFKTRLQEILKWMD